VSAEPADDATVAEVTAVVPVDHAVAVITSELSGILAAAGPPPEKGGDVVREMLSTFTYRRRSRATPPRWRSPRVPEIP
jgi:hypothetical protein